MFGVKQQWNFLVCIHLCLYLLPAIQNLTQAMIPKDLGKEVVSNTNHESGLTAVLALLDSPRPSSEIADPWREPSPETSSFYKRVDKPKRNIVELMSIGSEELSTHSKKANVFPRKPKETDVLPASFISSVPGASSDFNNHGTLSLAHLDTDCVTNGESFGTWGNFGTEKHGSKMTPSCLYSVTSGLHNMDTVVADSFNDQVHHKSTEQRSPIGHLLGTYDLLENLDVENQKSDVLSENTSFEYWNPHSAQLKKYPIKPIESSNAKSKEVFYDDQSPSIENFRLKYMMSGEDICKNTALEPQLDYDFYSNIFQAHKPIELCATLATHLTSRLVKRIFGSLEPVVSEENISKFSEVWNSETLLPFAYFIILANPSLELWIRVEIIMAVICRTYHKNCLFHNGTIDFETLAKFLVWHAGIFHQMINPMIPLDLGKENEPQSNLFTRNYSIHSLARIFLSLHSKVDLEIYFTTAKWTLREAFAHKHLSNIWMRDVAQGYPHKLHSKRVEGSVWNNWIGKSTEIASTIKDQWFLDELAIYSKGNSAAFLELLNTQMKAGKNVRYPSEFPDKVILNYKSLELFYSIMHNPKTPPQKLNLLTQKIAYFFKDYISEKNPDIWAVTKDDNYVTLLARFFHLIRSGLESKPF
ncbi:hypothetical protein CROQUDRAFT_131339 [Cronartium quercuum f. sp. fusiforme G11]|uniref:Uncharacterized protein n=1 Tax=Cronartium quercuum f. sp. fusiforme G11 TaxID=708437 RepID=A0A9P6NSG2_9BASI|nr:hypothetical protein CROQUDRAFT_131339 [Cronartium quercuum f. sp. fusiforme G11]